MGAGQGKAGIGRYPYLAGDSSAAVARQSLALVPKYDLETRSYPLISSSNGLRVEGVSPVVQQVAHALGIRRRALRSAKDVGTDFVKIGQAPREKKLAAVRTEVARALARIVERGDARVESVEVEDPPVPGRTFYRVSFVDLRSPERPKVTLRIEE